MTNTTLAVTGDIVRYVGNTTKSLTNGELFEVTGHGHSEWLAGNYAEFTDREGMARAFWTPSKYEIVGKVVEPKETLLDIQGNTVSVGDTVAYAERGNLKLFEVTQIGRGTAMVKADDGVVLRVGCFEDRAIKVSK